MRVLVVEDDMELARGLVALLRSGGMVVDHAADGRDAQELGCVEKYDAAVLDLGLPGQDGISVLRHWRDQGQHFPVLVLTARGRWSDKLDAFQAGADDYLTKPFIQEEVLTRLRVIYKRTTWRAPATIHVGPLAFDPVSNRFTLDGQTLVLTAQEERILSFLVARQGQVVSRTDISEHVYARDLDPDSNTVDVLIGRIRRKLAQHHLIHTERGRGFRLQYLPSEEAG